MHQVKRGPFFRFLALIISVKDVDTASCLALMILSVIGCLHDPANVQH